VSADKERFSKYDTLCYQADGVLWFPDRVEVVQHKRSSETKPLEKVSKFHKSFVALDDALRGAGNQLAGYTNDGGTDARGEQPETPPSGLDRNLVINIHLSKAEKPADLAEYVARINTVMAEKAGNGAGPELYQVVQTIQIQWGTGNRRASATFKRVGKTYQVA
jgi:hypothetical protein